MTAGFIGIEAICRFVLGLGTPSLSVTHPTIEYLFAPNQDIYRFSNHFQTNAWGMRSPAFSRRKLDPSEFRIMVFGDSVINGGNLTDQSELATTLIRQKLAKTLQRSVVVGNISAGSWGPGNWRAYAEQYGFFDADCVLLVVNSGDIGDCPTFAPLDPNTHPTEQPLCATSELILRYLPRYIPGNAVKDSVATAVSANSAAAEVGMNDMQGFLAAAKTATENVHVVLYYSRGEIAGGLEPPEFEKVAALCEELGIPVHSSRRWFPIERVQELYRDDIHTNRPGQRQLADAILENIPFHSFNLDE